MRLHILSGIATRPARIQKRAAPWLCVSSIATAADHGPVRERLLPFPRHPRVGCGDERAGVRADDVLDCCLRPEPLAQVETGKEMARSIQRLREGERCQVCHTRPRLECHRCHVCGAAYCHSRMVIHSRAHKTEHHEGNEAPWSIAVSEIAQACAAVASRWTRRELQTSAGIPVRTRTGMTACDAGHPSTPERLCSDAPWRRHNEPSPMKKPRLCCQSLFWKPLRSKRVGKHDAWLDSDERHSV